MEKFTQLTKNLHDRRSRQIPSLLSPPEREREYHHLLPVNCPFSLSAWSACTFKDHFMPHLCLDISLKRMGNRCYLGKCPFCDSAQWRGAFLSSPNLHWIVSLGIIFILPSWLGKDDMSGDSTCDGR